MSNIDTIITKLQKDFGSSNVMKLDEVPRLDVISTGIPSLDYALEIGGWPRRLITEVYGAEQLGKSVLAMKGIASAQKMGLIPALITTEGMPDVDWAAVHGVDISNVVLMFAHTAEQMLEQAKRISADPEVGLMVIDSLSAVGTAKESTEDGKKQAYGISGIVAQMMHTLVPNCWTTNKACVIMNQVRDKMAGTYVTLTSPGGHSLHHGASVRIYLKRGGDSPNIKTAKVDGVDKPIARQITGIVKKNKTGSEGREAMWWIYHSRPDDMTGFPGRGVDLVTSVIGVGLAIGVVVNEGGKYSVPLVGYEQEWKDRGRAKFEAWLREDYVRADKIYELIKQQLEN